MQRKKNWTDPLVVLANKGEGKAEKKLRGVLRTVVLFKNRVILPRKIMRDLEETAQRATFYWHNKRRLQMEDKTVYETVQPHLQSALQITAEELPELQHFLQGGESTEKAWRIHYYQYLLQLIPRLQDPNWVASLKKCPGCKRLLMSTANYENKWCSPQCSKRIWARKYRARQPAEEEQDCRDFKCDGNEETITLEECKTRFRGKFYACRTCEKGGN